MLVIETAKTLGILWLVASGGLMMALRPLDGDAVNFLDLGIALFSPPAFLLAMGITLIAGSAVVRAVARLRGIAPELTREEELGRLQARYEDCRFTRLSSGQWQVVDRKTGRVVADVARESLRNAS